MSLDEKTKCVSSASKVLHDLFHRHAELTMCGSIQFVFGDEPVGAQAYLVHFSPELSVSLGCDSTAAVAIDCRLTDISQNLGSSAFGLKLVTGEISFSGNLDQISKVATLLAAGTTGDLSDLPEQEAEGGQRFPSIRVKDEYLSKNRVPQILNVERRRNLSYDEFHKRYAEQGVPVLLEGYAAQWPLTRMSLDDIKAVFTGLRGYALVRKAGSDKESAQAFFDPEVETVTMADFDTGFGMPMESGQSAPYIANLPVPENLLDLASLPEFYEPEDYPRPGFWMGPAGTVTRMHRDSDNNFLTQVHGSKHIILAAPHYWEALGSFSRNRDEIAGFEPCMVDPEDLDAWPQAKDVHFIHIELHAGDTLYLPAFWYHHIRSTSTSISLTAPVVRFKAIA